jgi:Zn-dependent protease with chaperone function
MEEQNFKNHAKLVKGFHGLLFLSIIALLIGAVVNLFSTSSENLYLASLVVLIAVIFLIMSWFVRSFPLKAQDRAIKAEENLRYYVMTGKLFPIDLKMPQIIALRFASDEEFLPLVEKALKENLTNKEIKMLIKNWKADFYRV